MSDQPVNPVPDPKSLQFERAELPPSAASALSCTLCRRPISDTYYQANGKIVCPDCRGALEIQLVSGSGGGRFARALGFGIGAMLLSAGAWYAVLKLTDSEFGILAILVGLFVGAAVRRGAERRGGWRYQALAMVLTYTAIVFSYTPFVLKGLAEAKTSQADTVQVGKSDAARPSGVGQASTRVDPAAAPSGGQIVLGLAFLAAVLYAAPIVSGFSNPIGLIIIAIGLYEAWKLNKRLIIQIAGPFRVGAARAGA